MIFFQILSFTIITLYYIILIYLFLSILYKFKENLLFYISLRTYPFLISAIKCSLNHYFVLSHLCKLILFVMPDTPFTNTQHILFLFLFFSLQSHNYLSFNKTKLFVHLFRKIPSKYIQTNF